MINIKKALNELMAIDGAMGACIVDYTSGMSLGFAGGGDFDLELAAAESSEVLKSKLNSMRSLGIKDTLEDMMITLQTQLHIIRPSQKHEGLFIYLVLDKSSSNLALSRRKVTAVESELSV